MEKTETRITLLVDNTAHQGGLATEHGLAFWIEHRDQRILFDTGQGKSLLPNAAALGIDLASADALALSHGHYDHSGGLAQAWLKPETAPLYLHLGALTARYRVDSRGVKALGMPPDVREFVGDRLKHVRELRGPVELLPGAWLTGSIPRLHVEESSQEPFFMDPQGHQRDAFLDDQALYLLTGRGVVVLLGCAHAGVLNTLEHILGLTAGAPLAAVLGGFHLRSASAARLRWTLEQLQRLDPALLAPTHCTGDEAAAALTEVFGPRCAPGGAGRRFTFPHR